MIKFNSFHSQAMDAAASNCSANSSRFASTSTKDIENHFKDIIPSNTDAKENGPLIYFELGMRSENSN